MDALFQDLRYAARRQVVRAPGFSLLVVGVLALGIGANTALFTLGNALLLRPRPGVADPGRLVWVAAVREGHPNPLSLPDFREFREQVDAFSALAAFHDVEVWSTRRLCSPCGRQRDARVRDFGPKGRDPAAVCGGSTPLRTVLSCVAEPKPDPGASRGHAQPSS